MTPEVKNLPLKIVHDFPYDIHLPIEQKKAVVTSFLSDLKSRGFGGIVSNVTFREYTKNEDEWKVFKFVSDECERLGMRLWIYDERGYPSGGAGGMTLKKDPSYEARAIVLISSNIAPGEAVTVPLPKGHSHFLYAGVYEVGKDGKLVCGKNGKCIPISIADCYKSTSEVILKNPSNRSAKICVFAEKFVYEGTHSVHNVFEARRYIDVTNRDAVAEFLNNTYEKYANAVPEHLHAGAGRITPIPGQIEAIFTDEPSFMGCYINKGLYPGTTYDQYDEEIPLYPVLSYGRDVENEFSSHYGYDLLENLVEIFLCDSEYSCKVRYDYYTLLSDLYEQNFFAQISDWCARHEISFSGHLLLEEEIMHHTVFEGNYFNLLRHMHFPGIDMLQSIPSKVREFAFTPKLVSSIAKAYNRPHVMSEVSAHAQGGNVTYEQMYCSLCAQYALGVDIFTYYYSENFMEPETYIKYNSALGRIDATMAGKTVSDVLLYYPIETFRRHHHPSDEWYGSYTKEELSCSKNLYEIMNILLDNQIDFDFIDATSLSNFITGNENDKTFSSSAGYHYDALILPPMDYTEEMTRLLTRYTDRFNTINVCNEKVKEALPELIKDKALISKEAAPGVLRLIRDTENGRACMLVNTNERPINLSYEISGMKAPVLYDPFNDCDIPCDFVKKQETFEFNIEFSAMQTLIIKEKA